MRKAIAMFLTAALLISLALPAALAADSVEIKLMTWHGPETVTKYYAGYEEIANDYMAAHPEVKVTLVYEDDRTYGTILETGFAGGTAPDIIQMKSGQRLSSVANLLNLRPFLQEGNPYDTRATAWVDNFTGSIDAFPAEDNLADSNAILFIPNDGNPEITTGSMYIYNKALVAKAGLNPEQPPVTWKDFYTWLEALKAVEGISPIAGSKDVGGKVSQLGYCFGSEYANKFFADEFNTEEFANDFHWDKFYILTCYEGGEGMPLDNLPYYPAMFKLMRQHMSYYQESWIENSPETEQLTFISGRAALMSTTFYGNDTITSALSPDAFPDGYGMFSYPYFGGADTLAYCVEKGWITQEEADAAAPYANDRPGDGGNVGKYDYGFCVNKTVADDPARQAAVIDFLRYFSSKTAQEKYIVTANSISPITEVPVLDSMKTFIVTPPPEGYCYRTLGYTVIEWGKAGWDIELLQYLKGEMPMEDMVAAISAPEWKGDIPAMDALQQAVDTAKSELDAATEADKDAKDRAFRFAELRLKLLRDYYWEKTGNLEPLR